MRLTSVLTLAIAATLSEFTAGAAAAGVDHSLDPAAAVDFSVLYNLKGGADGALATTSITTDPSSNAIYGTTVGGGSSNCTGGCGIVFRLTPKARGEWSEKILHSFAGGKDGQAPTSVAFLNGSALLYGVTEVGGRNNCDQGCGTVYSLARPAGDVGKWAKAILHDFAGPTRDGAYPFAPLVMDADGAILGTTIRGGKTTSQEGCFSFRLGCGTIFKLTPPAPHAPSAEWSASVPHDFTGGADGSEPTGEGLVRDKKGNYYGTTAVGGDPNCRSPFEFIQSGCGTVYKFTPDGKRTFTVIHTFKGGRKDGNTPQADKLAIGADGALYGATVYGGAHSFGLVYKLTPPASGAKWDFTVLYSFTGRRDGGNPYAAPVLVGDVLYGTTFQGGDTANCSVGCGTVYKLTPGDATIKTLYRFNGTDGSGPTARLVRAGKALIGTTRNGGDNTNCTNVSGKAAGCGNVFKIIP